MIPGTKVIHELTKEEMVIKKIYGSVASCFVDRVVFKFHWKEIKVVICSIDNLKVKETEPIQLQIFI